MRSFRRLFLFAGLVSLGLLAGALPAQAGAPDYFEPPTRYNDPYSFDPQCDGLNLKVTGRARGVLAYLNVAGSDGQAFLVRDRYRFREVWKNLDTGEHFVVSGHGFFREVKATFVPTEQVPADLVPPEGIVGPVYLFRAVETGNPFTVTDDDGHVVVKDVGRLVSENLFDTLGDSKPGGTSLSFEFVEIVGPHPGLDVDLCELAPGLTVDDDD